MPYLILILAFISVFIAKLIYDERKNKAERRLVLKDKWGQLPDTEYTSEKRESIKGFYHSRKDKQRDIDDITWNDLSMDEIYGYLNNTSSAPGEEYLYFLLRKPQYEEETLKERKRLIDYFSDHEKERIDLQLQLSRVGKLRNISLFEYINRADDVEKGSLPLHYFCAGSLILAVLLTLCSDILKLPVMLGAFLVLGCIAHNIAQYYKRKFKIEKYFNVFVYILKLLDGVKHLNKQCIPELKKYQDTLADASKAFARFKKGSFLLVGGNSGSLADAILDYERMLFHSDLIKFEKMADELSKNKPALNQIFETIGMLDSMIAAASFREWLPAYCEPILVRSKTPFLRAKEVYHPMVLEPVKNSISADSCILLTGSNASGKSTFIKTVAINAILSQTIFTSPSLSYEASYFKIFSSMALTDNLLGKESYYIVEVKSLKRILDQLEKEIPMLCFVDEVLRGTNTLERIAASSRILYSFAGKNAICFAATHDIELTYILESTFSNYHFQEQIVKEEILFDYKLYQGRAVSRNAIKLLGIMGYEQKMIDEAAKAANEFLEKGSWSSL